MAKQIKLEIFSDYVWPWCYLSTGRIEKLKNNYELEIEIIHFPLHPETPDEGLLLEDLFAGRDVDIEAMYSRMKGLMDAEGLEYGKRTHTYNSRLAQELGKWADEKTNRGYDYESIHDALYKAYFVDAHNIGDEEVLLGIATNVGLPENEVRTVLFERTHKDAVDSDWAKSKEHGVTGVPTFIAGGYGLVGAQPYEALEQLLNDAHNPITKTTNNRWYLGGKNKGHIL